MLVAVDDFRGELPHLLPRHAVAHRQLVEALAGQIGKRECRPEKRRDQAHAMPLGRGDHAVESSEILRAVGEEKIGIRRPVSTDIQPGEGHTPPP